MKHTVDFLIIGAQKSATTSLFRYLSAHPSVFMPPEKETNYYSDNVQFAKGIDYYLSEYFNNADPSGLWGEASPSYMCYDYVPNRIYHQNPQVKLIAILRNPIDRAFSQYQMSRVRQLEDRSFSICVEDSSPGRNAPHAAIDVDRAYVSLGEYGRILSNYLQYFRRERILILFAEHLAINPAGEIQKVYKFLGVADDFTSPVFKKKYNVGGQKKHTLLRKVVLSKIVRSFFRSMVPPQMRRAWGYWFITEFATERSDNELHTMESTTRTLLRDHYVSDVKHLSETFQIQVPWTDFIAEQT